MWPENVRIADRLLVSEPHFESTVTFNSKDKAKVEAGLIHSITGLVSSHFRGGFVLVKTSTTGNRSRAHEVSDWLISSVLRTLSVLVGPQSICLGDGPAYARSYQAECVRLGLDTLINSFGVEVVDLNADEHVELLTGWPVSKKFLQADIVVNLCKAKTHRRFGVSLGAKSLLGVLTGSILGHPKLVGKHRCVPWLVSRLSESSPPTLTVIDGERGIEGEGPLNGWATSSHFITVGFGYFGPDVKAASEMGFDPALIPYFIRPYESDITEAVIDWDSTRVTRTDFLPAGSCSWLYKSAANTRHREKVYKTVLQVARECWTPPT